MSDGGFKYPTKKIFNHGKLILVTTGAVPYGNQLMRWFKDGAKHEDFPHSEQEARLMVFCPEKGVSEYCGDSEPEHFGFNTCAWGTGAPYAMGAMKAGATAKEAAAIACECSSSCGLGLDVKRIRK